MEIVFFDETQCDIVLDYSKIITNELNAIYENVLDSLNTRLYNNEVIGVKIKNKLISIEIINKANNSIEFIFVDKNYRNKGIASAMVSIALRVLGVGEGVNICVNSSSDLLNKFVTNFGFKKISTNNGLIFYKYK